MKIYIVMGIRLEMVKVFCIQITFAREILSFQRTIVIDWLD